MRAPLALRLALRDLRSGLAGLYVFIACIILGVAAIAAIGSLSEAIARGIENEGQPLLGGDIEIAVPHREVPERVLQYLGGLGDVSAVATLRAMVGSHKKHLLVEIKAVDGGYPLFGRLDLEGGGEHRSVVALQGARHGIAVDPLLLERLKVKSGDVVRIGEADFEIRAVIAREPDRIAGGISLGPRVLMSEQALAASGLLKPGSLVTWRYRLKLRPPLAPADVAQAINRDFPETSWHIRTRTEAAPGLTRYVERLTFFVTLIGITSLLAGGVGIANSVKTFIERRRRPIAVLRLIGTPSATVFAAYLCEIMLVAAGAILFAGALGSLLPYAVSHFMGGLLPVPIKGGFYLKPLALAAVFGTLTTLLFLLWPLSRIREIPPLEVVRHRRFEALRWPKAVDLPLILLPALGLIAAGLIAFDDPLVTLWYVFGVAASFLLLLGLGAFLVLLAGRIPKPSNAALRLAISNLSRPETSARSIVLSLGLGVTVLLTLSLVGRSLQSELRSTLPAAAPSYFFLDVPASEKNRFLEAVREEPTVTAVRAAPMLRGRITKVKDKRASDVKAAPDGAWALRGDRGLTYSEEIPEGSKLVAGTWWPKNHDGPPLVSLTADVARAIGLKIGDSVSVNVLGRELTATVASLRDVDWRSLGMNFVMVFSPNALSAAPHGNLVTVSLPPEREAAFLDRIASAFPTVTAIRVKDALDTVSDLLEKTVLGLRGTSVLTLLTGTLVLTGALAANLSARTYDAVVLKTCGATRSQLVFIFAVEFLILGLAAALFSILAGSLAAWAIVRFLLEIPLDASLPVVAGTALLAVVGTLAAGLASLWTVLGASPAAHLRTG